MKSIVIIAIVVVCSVVAVFAVLVSVMLHEEYQYEKAVEDYNEEQIEIQKEQAKIQKEKEYLEEWNNRSLCASNFSDKLGSYEYCVEHGYHNMLEKLKDYCKSFDEVSYGYGECIIKMAEMLGNQKNPPIP